MVKRWGISQESTGIYESAANAIEDHWERMLAAPFTHTGIFIPLKHGSVTMTRGWFGSGAMASGDIKLKSSEYNAIISRLTRFLDEIEAESDWKPRGCIDAYIKLYTPWTASYQVDGKKKSLPVTLKERILEKELDEGDSFKIIPLFPKEVLHGRRREFNGIKPLYGLDPKKIALAYAIAEKYKEMGHEVNEASLEYNTKNPCFIQVCTSSSVIPVKEINTKLNNGTSLIYRGEYKADSDEGVYRQSLQVELSKKKLHFELNRYGKSYAAIKDLVSLVDAIGEGLRMTKKIKFYEKTEHEMPTLDAITDKLGAPFRYMDKRLAARKARLAALADKRLEIVVDMLKQGGAKEKEAEGSCFLIMNPACVDKRMEKDN